MSRVSHCAFRAVQIPVDTFFDSYVDTLGAAAAEGQQETGSNGKAW